VALRERAHPPGRGRRPANRSQEDRGPHRGREFVKPERQPAVKQPSKAELAHRIEEAVEYLRGSTSGSGKSVAQAVLAILDPPAQQATEPK
jgi:hypothetical protein